MLRRVFDRWEPPLGDLEGDYRRHFLARDIGEARAAGWLGITVILLFVAPDFYFFGWGPMFAGLLLLRVAHVALAMTLIGRLRQARRPEPDGEPGLISPSACGQLSTFLSGRNRHRLFSFHFDIARPKAT